MTGISATSSCPSASRSASRLGTSRISFGLRRQMLQVADERLGVEVIDRADANRMFHAHFSSFSIRSPVA